MISLPPRRVRKRKETDLVGEVLTALQRISGARPLRNNNGVLEDIRGVPVRYGLGNGSPDIVGAITMGGGRRSALERYAHMPPIAFAFGIELKMPGKNRSPDQISWHAVAAEYGMSIGTAWTVAEACDQVRAEIARIDRWISDASNERRGH